MANIGIGMLRSVISMTMSRVKKLIQRADVITLLTLFAALCSFWMQMNLVKH
jgi:hypothetical protein